MESAKRGLTHITDQIDKRVPGLRFKTYTYKGCLINKLNTERSFFKLLFGRLFSKLEKPYFSYLGEFVILSNSEQALQETIDDYVRGRTLASKSDFVGFKDNFGSKANAAVFVQMPKLYTLMYYFSNSEKRESMSKNRELLMSFSLIGFQLESDNGMFHNTMMLEHDETAVLSDKLDLLELEASNDVFFENFDSTWIDIDFPDEVLLKEGEFKLYYDTLNKHKLFEGQVVGGSVNGLGKRYYKSGNIMSSLNYEYSRPVGFAAFFYDDASNQRWVESTLKNSNFVGKYNEFYKNGARKSSLFFNENGMPHGEAQFFYQSGILKMEGEYKNGAQNGKWKYFNEDGQVYNTEKYRKGRQR